MSHINRQIVLQKGHTLSTRQRYKSVTNKRFTNIHLYSPHIHLYSPHIHLYSPISTIYSPIFTRYSPISTTHSPIYTTHLHLYSPIYFTPSYALITHYYYSDVLRHITLITPLFSLYIYMDGRTIHPLLLYNLYHITYSL